MPRLKHKFNAVRCEEDGIKFPSKKERDYYHKLKILKESGKILFFLMQVPFRLPGNTVYRIDFVEFWAPKEGEEAGDVVFTEVKGFLNPLARLKILQAEEIYNIHINIV